MKLPESAHTGRDWRIHEIAAGFEVEDVWELPTPGGPDDFPHLVELVATVDPSESSAIVRALFAIRWKVGELLGWDGPSSGHDPKGPTLRERLPADLRDTPTGPEGKDFPFSPLYLLDDEWAVEIANRTVHGVLHLGWVPDESGPGYHGQMAVLVKRNGLLGSAYMTAITPFRYLIVYPMMLREFGREWRRRESNPRPRTRDA